MTNENKGQQLSGDSELEKFLVGRVSIYDEKTKVVGYEIEIQEAQNPSDEHIVPKTLNARALADLFQYEKYKHMIGKGWILINFSWDMLLENFAEILDKEKIYIVLDEKNLEFNTLLLTRVSLLKEKGWHFVLSGFWKELSSFLPLVSWVKINIKGLGADVIHEYVANITKEGTVKPWAYQVDSHEMYALAKKSGFAYFSGNFLNLPNLINKGQVKSNRLVAMRLMMALEDPDISITKVEDLLSQDSKLSFRLMKVVNSAAFGLPRKIDSLRQAIMYLGLQQIRTWANLILLSSTEDKAQDLTLMTMIRAKMCELTAEYAGADYPKSFFTAGLFSTLDALLDREMKDVLAEISLSDELNRALLDHEGEVGAILENVMAYERGDWGELINSGIDSSAWRSFYLESVAWATNLHRELYN